MADTKSTIHVANNQDSVRAGKDAEFVSKLENALLHVAGLSGTYYRGPWQDDWLNAPPRNEDAGPSPVPPDALRHWYSLGQEEQYLSSGERTAGDFRDCYQRHFGDFRPGEHLMEIGCSAGRVVRWFQPEADTGVNVWGTDIDAAGIMWAQQNLPSNLRFFTNTTAPSLPFRDGTFNMIYGNSLFTHIGELAEYWMLEVSRVLDRERGAAVITFNDGSAMKRMLDADERRGTTVFRTAARASELAKTLAEDGVAHGKLVFNSSPWQQSVWYSNEYLSQRLSQYFKILDVVPSVGGIQTGYVLTPLF